MSEGASTVTSWRGVIKVVLFALLCVAIVVAFSWVAPVQGTYGEDRDKGRGMAEAASEPVQVVAVGSSTMFRAFSPLRLLEEHGIASYNLGTSAQPSVVSYYMLRSALESFGDSLKVAVVDVSPFTGTRKSSAVSGLEKNLMYMRGSLPLKAELLGELEGLSPRLSLPELLVPIERFHSQWSGLKESHFTWAVSESIPEQMLGQSVESSCFSNVTRGRAGEYSSETNETITDDIETAGASADEYINERRMRDFERVIALCEERGVKILLVKLPDCEWDDSRHDYLLTLAEEHGLPFVDFCSPAVWEDCSLSYDTDCLDGEHVNLRGSVKVTDYLGEFINEELGVSGAVTDGGFHEDDRRLFDGLVEDAELCQCADLGRYLELLDRDRYTVFVATQGESAAGLTDELREGLATLGFEELAALEEGASYVGVSDEGVKVERTNAEGDKVVLYGSYKRFKVNVNGKHMQRNARFNVPLTLSSLNAQGESEIQIHVMGSERAEGKRGLNFVVYDKDLQQLVDTASFDTHEDCARTSDLLDGE